MWFSLYNFYVSKVLFWCLLWKQALKSILKSLLFLYQKLCYSYFCNIFQLTDFSVDVVYLKKTPLCLNHVLTFNSVVKLKLSVESYKYLQDLKCPKIDPRAPQNWFQFLFNLFPSQLWLHLIKSQVCSNHLKYITSPIHLLLLF